MHAPGIQAALGVMQAHLRALNAGDAQALAATLHFPHYRLVDGALQVWETPGAYLADFRRRAGGAWAYSAWGALHVLAASESKVHLDVQVERYRADHTLLIRFHSLWVIARLGGIWAAQLRSSFAPDEAIRAGAL